MNLHKIALIDNLLLLLYNYYNIPDKKLLLFREECAMQNTSSGPFSSYNLENKCSASEIFPFL